MNPLAKNFVVIATDEHRDRPPPLVGSFATANLYAEPQTRADVIRRERKYLLRATIGVSFASVEHSDAVEFGKRHALEQVGAILYRDSLVVLEKMKHAFCRQDQNEMSRLLREMEKTFEWVEGFTDSEKETVRRMVYEDSKR